MSMYDRPRDPNYLARNQMATVDNRADGRVDQGAVTEYPTSGPRRPADREVARRRQVEISGRNGQEMFNKINDALDAAGMSRNHPDGVHARKDAAMGVACGSWCRASDPYAGYVGGAVRLEGPQRPLSYLLTGVAR
jgi:hypothetical protein